MMLPGLRRAILTCMAVALIMPAAVVDAGPFEDLLFGRRNAYYYPVGDRYVPAAPAVPVVAGYAPLQTSSALPTTVLQSSTGCGTQVTAGYAPVQTVAPAASAIATTSAAMSANYPPAVAATTHYAPVAPTTVVAPTTAYAPALPGCGCSTPAPVRTVNMYPAVPNYRTVWYRVPTTNFRPVTAFDPATCAQVTTLQPCTTYTWQARRVPARGGFFSWLFHRRGTARTAPIYPYSACVTQPVISTGTPAVMTAPGVTVQGSQAPADIPPSLDPGVYVPPSGASIQGSGTSVPSDTQPFASPSYESARPLIEAPPLDLNSQGTVDLSVPNANGASATQADDGSQSNDDPNGNGSGSFEDRNSSATNGTGTSIRHNRSAPNPVPDPNAAIQKRRRFAPPKLINPRDRRASTGPAPGSFVLVHWPSEPPREPAAAAANVSQPAQPASAPQVNPKPARSDSGWRSIPR